jgi:hypothetical protein
MLHFCNPFPFTHYICGSCKQFGIKLRCNWLISCGTIGEPDGNLMGTIKNKESPLPPLKKSKEKKVVSTLTLE